MSEKKTNNNHIILSGIIIALAIIFAKGLEVSVPDIVFLNGSSASYAGIFDNMTFVYNVSYLNFTPEDLEDSHLHSCANITDATSDLCTITDSDTQLSQETVQDYVGAMAGDHLTYTDGSNDLSVNDDWYNSLSDLQAAVSNDFHNLGGSDDDDPEEGEVQWSDLLDQGSFTNGKYCTYASGTGYISCTSEGGGGAGKQGDDIYLYNDSTTMYFNETKVNQTIDTKISLISGTDINQTWANATYILQSEEGNLNVNSTVELASDPTDCSYGYVPQTIDSYGNFGGCKSVIFSEDEPFLSVSHADTCDSATWADDCESASTASSCDSATFADEAGIWVGYSNPDEINVGVLINDAGYITNQTMNKTVDCVDIDNAASNLCAIEDTTYTAGSNLSLVGTVFSVDISSLTSYLDTLYLTASPFGVSIDDTELTSEDFGEFTCTGAEDGCTLNAGSYDDEYIELGDTFGGDVTGTYNSIAVSDDSHNHIYTNIDPFTESNLYSILTDVSEFIETGDSAILASLNTGHGANELHAMNQDVETTDDVEFNSVNVSCVYFQNGASWCET